MKKIIFTVLATSLFMGCVSAPPKKEAPVKKPAVVYPLEVFDEENFIDISDTSVKFLFKALKGDLVDFYFGDSKDTLKLVENDFLAGSRGLKIDNLEPNKEYFYQIVVKRGSDQVKSDILSIIKQGNTNNWSVPKWGSKAVFYEIFVRSFSDGNGDGIGDFIGLKNKIPYLKELGIDALWLMPINQSPSYHGYDVYDYYDVEMDYGTLDDFKALLQEAHDNDIKIVMDLVINHSSTEHPWFQNSASAEDSEFRNYYDWADNTDNVKKNGPFGGNQWHGSKTGKYNGVFWSGMPDMNLRNKNVRDEFKNIATFWLEMGVDGFRLDAALHIDDEDKDVSHNWWQEFNTHVKSVNPDAILIGENWASTNKMASFFEDLEASFNFSFANNILEMSRGKKVNLLETLSSIHSSYSNYNKDFIDATFITNHDQDRVASVLNGDVTKQKFAASILLTLPGAPFIYYGEELGMLGKKPDDNIREPMDWYKNAQGEGMTTMNKGGFYNSMLYTKADDGISYEEQALVDGSTLEHYKKLIDIRKSNPEFFDSINYSRVEILDELYSYEVKTKTSKIVVIHNYNKEEKNFTLDSSVTSLLSKEEYAKMDSITIPSFSSLILEY